MSTITLFVEHTSAGDVYFRIFNNVGEVFNFSSNAFEALSGSSSHYVTSSERGDMAGTGRSGYTATVDLTTVNNSAAAQFVVKAYANGTPVVGDNPIAPTSTNETILPASHIWVEFGELGRGEIIVAAEVNVKSTAGSTAQVACWLERNGVKLDIDAIHSTATAVFSMREHGGASNLFDENMTVATNLKGDRFEAEKSSPNFVDDRQYEIIASITENGNTHTTTHSSVVIG